MELDNFKQEIINRLQDEGYSATIDNAEKINYQNQEVIIVKENEKDAVGITYSIQELYDSYARNSDLEVCVNMIKRALLQIHEEALDYVMKNINPEHLTLHMCDINSNRELLSKSVFYEVSPTLAAVAYFDVSTDRGNACVRVNEHLLSQLGMTKNEVLECCISNLENNDFVVKNLNEVIKEMMGNDIFSMDEEEIPMYVATNKSKIQGSNILASKKALHNSIYNSVGEDCYILPSSTHEVLFVPKSSGFDIAILKDMVETVNRTEVNPKDKLSDNVFEYNLSTRTLSLANTEDREKTKARGKKICI